MREVIDRRLYTGSVGKDKVDVNILQYADDTIFFVEASVENIKAIKAILRAFEMVSGLKINFAKSNFEAIGMPESWKQNAANFLNCCLLTIPFVYLGITIGANSRKCQTWDLIIQKCERRLAKWKQRNISLGGGRVTLIQSILTSIPTYFLSFFKIPRRVVEKLIRIQRNFLWGDCVGEVGNGMPP